MNWEIKMINGEPTVLGWSASDVIAWGEAILKSGVDLPKFKRFHDLGANPAILHGIWTEKALEEVIASTDIWRKHIVAGVEIDPYALLRGPFAFVELAKYRWVCLNIPSGEHADRDEIRRAQRRYTRKGRLNVIVCNCVDRLGAQEAFERHFGMAPCQSVNNADDILALA